MINWQRFKGKDMAVITITTDDAAFAAALRDYCALGGHGDIAVEQTDKARAGILHVAAQGSPAPATGLVLPVRLGSVIDRARQLAHRPAVADRAFGDHVLLMQSALLQHGDQQIRLTEKERDILAALHAAGDAGLERQVLLEAVWGYSAAVETHTLETHIYRLRQKIEADPARPVILLTEENGGYRLVR